RSETPELLHLQAAADGDVAHAHDRSALRGGGRRGRGCAAFELHDGGLDAALGEEAELLRHIGRGMHDVGWRDRDADVDLAHGRSGLRRRFLRASYDQGGKAKPEINGFPHSPFSFFCSPLTYSSDAAVHGATYFSISRSSAVNVTPSRPSVTIGTNILST